MRPQLFAQMISSFLVFLLPGYFVKKQETSAGGDIVDIVLGCVVGTDRSVSVDEGVESLLNKTEVVAITGTQPNAFHTFQHHAILVGPPGWHSCFIPRRIAPECSHRSRRDALRHRFVLGKKRRRR